MSDIKPPPMADETVSRRDFLKLAWGAAGLLALVEAGGVALSFFSPRTVEGQFGGVFEVGKVDDFPPGSVTPFNAGRFYLVRFEDGGFLALYRKCTHLGCAVPWNQAEQKFICPCHASAFERDGQVLNPPAPRPLDRFVVAIVDGMVRVDTGAPIQRDRTGPADLVYA
ncbi:MAG: Rieske (2Fe-2S) protein [Chloroflexi bacterium]|nr:Rieske (2Fe-2S) protein [Chloroflexota bacterium]MDL1885005.1 Rieske 2Fe-2S domain-containing protein [Anaerolineae bacterium CFX8]